MMTTKFESAIEIKEKREFVLNDTFMIFLVEKEKDLPYFAAKISDITNEQNIFRQKNT